MGPAAGTESSESRRAERSATDRGPLVATATTIVLLLLAAGAATAHPAGALELGDLDPVWCHVDELLPDAELERQTEGARLSDDGSTFVVARRVEGDRHLVVHDLVGGGSEALDLPDESAPQVRFVSDNGEQVIFTDPFDHTGGNADGSREIFVLDRTDGDGIRQLTDLPAESSAVAASMSDDGGVLVVRTDVETTVVDVATGASSPVPAPPAGWELLEDPLVSGDGSSLLYLVADVEPFDPWAVSLADYELHHLDLDTAADTVLRAEQDVSAAGPFGYPVAPVDLQGVSDDGTRVHIRKLGNSEQLLVVDGDDIPVSGSHLNADGTQLAQISLGQLQVFDVASQSWGSDEPFGVWGQQSALLSEDHQTVVLGLSNGFLDDRPDLGGYLRFDRGSGALTEIDLEGDLHLASLSSDGQTVVASTAGPLGGGDGTRDVVVQRTAGGPLDAITEGPWLSDTPTVDLGGETVVYRSFADPAGQNAEHRGELFVHDLTTGEVEQLTDTSGVGLPEQPQVSADGQLVSFISTADHAGLNPSHLPQAFVLDRSDDSVEQVTDATDTRVQEVRMSPDGRWLVLTTFGPNIPQEVVLIDRTGVHADRAVDEPGAFSDDGDLLLVAGEAYEGLVVTTEDLAPVPHDHQQRVRSGRRWNLAGDGSQVLTDATSWVERLDLEREEGQRLIGVPNGEHTSTDRDASRLTVQRSSTTYAPQAGLEIATCSTFLDVQGQNPFVLDVDWGVATGVITGYPDQTFRPSAPVTRQAMAAFLYRLAGAYEPLPAAAPFDDVSAEHPFATEIAWAADQAITTGYHDGTFRPGSTVTRQATAAFLHRLADADDTPPSSDPFTDVDLDHPFATEIAWAADQVITTGYPDGSFRPSSTVTRQAAAAFLHRTQEHL